MKSAEKYLSGRDIFHLKAPLFLHWELTSRCNQNCIHCYNNSGEPLEDELSHSFCLTLAEELAEMKIFQVCLSGGEPLLHPKFYEIAQIFKSRKSIINTISNGWLVDEKQAEKISELVSCIQISIDGATPEVHDAIRRRKGSWRRAIKAVENLQNANIHFISLAFTIMKNNINQISEMIDLAAQLEIDFFHAITLIPIGRATLNNGLLPSHSALKKCINVLKKKKKEYENQIWIQWNERAVESLLNFGSEFPIALCTITANGWIKPFACLPIKLGNVKYESMETIWKRIYRMWEHPEVRRLREHYLRTNDSINLPYGPSYVGNEIVVGDYVGYGQ
jgi:MoaA/NifB/PqqE/SkfB family radical SAM enzyme